MNAAPERVNAAPRVKAGELSECQRTTGSNNPVRRRVAGRKRRRVISDSESDDDDGDDGGDDGDGTNPNNNECGGDEVARSNTSHQPGD